MIIKMIPRGFKSRLRQLIRAVAKQALYYPSHGELSSYCIPFESHKHSQGSDPAIPPPAFWMGYGGTPAEYLGSGKRDVEGMAAILGRNGFDMTSAARILDFGCAAGRMIRHCPAVAPEAELWGTDIGADQIQWCRHNLTPPMNFALTTINPHLPFADSFFDLIYCGSVFTHIEDLEQAWLLELGRILRPGGCLYLTIHDEHTVKRLDGDCRDQWLAKAMGECKAYVQNKHSFDMIVFGRGEGSLVFYRADYFRSLVPPLFDWDAHVPSAYGYQSAVMLRKRK